MNVENLHFGNAAGTVKTLSDVRNACKTAMTAITVGSITWQRQEGNKADKGSGRTYYHHPTEGWSINALGMPNMGMEEFLQVLPEMVDLAHRADKLLRVSVAGYSPEEYASMAYECYYTAKVDDVELNFGCPNIWGPDNKQKPIPSYDPTLARRILLTVRNMLPATQKVSVKVSPVDQLWTLRELVEMFGQVNCVSAVVGVNTIPNQERKAHDEHPALSFNDGNHKGGGAGSMIKKKSLQFHETARQYLAKHVDYYAVGGIETGEDAYAHFRLGAKGVQCATAYIEQGGKIFSDLIQQMDEIVEKSA